MLSKLHFSRIKEKGDQMSSPSFFVYIEKTSQKPLFGAVISKKVEKKAVNRNKTRRRVREAYRKSDFYQKYGLNGIVFIKKTQKQRLFVDIVEELNTLSKKLG